MAGRRSDDYADNVVTDDDQDEEETVRVGDQRLGIVFFVTR